MEKTKMDTKIKGTVPAYVEVNCDLCKKETRLVHDGKAHNESFHRGQGFSLDWLMYEADLMFKEGADQVALQVGKQGRIFLYEKSLDKAVINSSNKAPRRIIVYELERSLLNKRDVELDSFTLDCYKKRHI